MASTEAFVTVFRVLNSLKIGVCEEHAHSHSIVVLYIFYIKQQVTLDKMRFVTSLQLGASLTPKFAWPNLVKIKHLLLAY
jgi:hypothetical protein